MSMSGVHALQREQLQALSAVTYSRRGDDAGFVDELIEATHKRQRETRDQIFSNNLPFSWLRFLCGFASLALVCSDVPRSGLGFRDFSSKFLMVEPDVLQSFGPWYYSVQKLTKATASNATGKVWSYKYDSTSVSWRAFAVFYQRGTFPPCIMYRERWAGETLSGTTVFSMLDSIANATSEYGKRKFRSHKSTSTSRSYQAEPVNVTLRTESYYFIPAAQTVDDSTQNLAAIVPQEVRVVKKLSLKLSQVRDFVSGTITAISPTVLMSASAFELLQSQMEKLHHREDAHDANVALINLVCMSDPLYHLCYIRAGGGVWLGYYQSTRNPQKVLLLPRDAVTDYNTETQGLRLLGYVRSSRLKWSQVIHCG